ncbi:MAG TPA: hypothetical protein VD788_16985 [Candidatus Polarisedimenticolaceae bacterium]|nr:hypothetical protein [Candidatus Polarisedimenticolaceae bacterium]
MMNEGKRLYAVLSLVALVGGAAAAGQYEANVRRDVAAYFDALRVSDFPTLAGLTCPAVVDSVGGYGAFITSLQAMDRERAAQGIEWGEVTIESVSEPVVAGEQLHVLIEVRQQIGSPSGKTKKKTYMLGVSEDAGDSWTFVDATKLDAANKQKLFPEFNDALKLPKG